MIEKNQPTYISLFSSAGVGCYGFSKAGFKCIATNEIIERRIQIQKYNKKCLYDSGYICDDITKDSTKQRIIDEIEKWRKLGNDRVDVVIATPPCQGMSVANHKKSDCEITRNSLVVESIKMINVIKPRIFIFENVAAFMKTGCTSPDGSIKAIGDVIFNELASDYVITSRILNFKNYGSNSSRTRTVVIGVSKSISEFVSPVELYPAFRHEKTLFEVIGKYKSLKWDEIDADDFYHAFRTYPETMRCWIHDLNEGESAFDNADIAKQPHQVIDGQIVVNKRKNGDKYTRQFWNRVAPCIHTRNDQLASQNTIHPVDDRVFSIRELMSMMTIPESFMWTDKTLEELNSLSDNQKRMVYKKEEINIRQSIGEAVPTAVFYQIARNISHVLSKKDLNIPVRLNGLIESYNLNNTDELIDFIKNNPEDLSFSTLARIAELSNSKRENTAAYYTNKSILNEIYRELPDISKDTVTILEPSVGIGNFLPFIFRKYEDKRKIQIDVVDIDNRSLDILKCLLVYYDCPKNVEICFINDDFLLYKFDKRYDLVVGNPPFTKLKPKEAFIYRACNKNLLTTNTCEFFLEKALSLADYVAMIMPKFVLNTPEFTPTRTLLENMRITCIQDYGENGFKGVLVETVGLFVSTKEKPARTRVQSLTRNVFLEQKQVYICDNAYPYWIIYRDSVFDSVAKKLRFGVFDVFRDRQITNRNTYHEKKEGSIRVLKSRNINNEGTDTIDIPGYDAYIDADYARGLSVYKYFDDTDVYFTPNMTYYPRVIRNPGNVIVNGSIAILLPKERLNLTERQILYFSSEEYRAFYKVARNYQTRSLNVDATSVFFYGILI